MTITLKRVLNCFLVLLLVCLLFIWKYEDSLPANRRRDMKRPWPVFKNDRKLHAGFRNGISSFNLSDGYFHPKCQCVKHKYKKIFSRHNDTTKFGLPENWGPLNSSKSQMSKCSDEATFFGPGQSVVSFSLYGNFTGNGNIFSGGLIPNLKRMRKYYPEWVMRVYSDYPLVPGNQFCNLLCGEDDLFWCDIRNIPGKGDLSYLIGRTWRYLPIGDALVDKFVSRDIDSRLTLRDSEATVQWLTSNKTFHFMRDNVYHNIPVLAGMWGLKNNQLSREDILEIETNISIQSNQTEFWGWDQIFVGNMLYQPQYYDKIIQHDRFHCNRFDKALCLPFPTPYDGKHWVGIWYTADED